ncbi:MAG: 4-alpha-glucanotransferase [candidate division WOR-3 bacterium]
MNERGCGVLLPIFSLPSPFGIGDFGGFAYKFVDILAENKIKFWQILPLNPVDKSGLFSPYMSYSAFAYNFLFISPYFLIKEDLLSKDILKKVPDFKENEVEYERIYDFKRVILDIAYYNFKKKNEEDKFLKFCRENDYWLNSYSLFTVLKNEFKTIWNEWESKIRDRSPEVIGKLERKYEREIEKVKFVQYIFYKQFITLKRYANKRGVKIIGDIPIYVSYDSADVWENPQIFKLDENKKPLYVSGVPPDYFSEKGQLWGNPVYDWDKLRERNFDFWVKRIFHNLKFYDYIRIDHFRGFVGYYQIPYGSEDARIGEWVKAPAREFFDFIFKKFGKFNLIAEDLGFITDDVVEIMKIYDIPGMRVFQFGFGDLNLNNPHLPHNYPEKSFGYTSTHDTNTLKGWFEKEIKDNIKKFILDYLNISSEDDIWNGIMKKMLFSRASVIIIPVYDILFLGEEARINKPGTKIGNWKWRMSLKLFEELKEKIKILKKLIEASNR